MYCKYCGKEIDDSARFCQNCGEIIEVTSQVNQNAGSSHNQNAIRCPKCGSTNVDIQVHQEQNERSTITKTKSRYKQKGHGCFWWILFGWWWWVVDLFLWIFIFPVRFLIQLFKKKKYVGDTTSISKSHNKIKYRTICLCKNCGYHWDK